jgi:hypothetical protein
MFGGKRGFLDIEHGARLDATRTRFNLNEILNRPDCRGRFRLTHFAPAEATLS